MAWPEGRLEQRINPISYQVVMNLIKNSSFRQFQKILEINYRSIIFKNKIQTRGLTRAHVELSANTPDSREKLIIFIREEALEYFQSSRRLALGPICRSS